MESIKKYNELIIKELASSDNPTLSAKQREYLMNVLEFYEQKSEELEKWKKAYHKIDPIGFMFNHPLKQS